MQEKKDEELDERNAFVLFPSVHKSQIRLDQLRILPFFDLSEIF